MVDAKYEVVVAKEEGFTLFKSILNGTSLTLYGVISGLGW